MLRPARRSPGKVPAFNPNAQVSLAAAGTVEYQGFLGKFFLAKPRSSSGYALAADKKQLRIGAGMPPAKHLQCICCCVGPASSAV